MESHDRNCLALSVPTFNFGGVTPIKSTNVRFVLGPLVLSQDEV